MRSSTILFVIFVIVLLVAVNIDIGLESLFTEEDYHYYSQDDSYNDYNDSFEIEDDYHPVFPQEEIDPDENYVNVVNTIYEDDEFETNSEYSQYFYYKSLTDKQRDIYEKIVAGCVNYESTIKLNNNNQNDVYLAQSAVSYDHPEFYWLNSFVITTRLNNVVSISFEVPNDAQDRIERANDRVSAIISSSGTTDVERVKYFYDWIIDNTEYGDNKNSQDMTSVFIDGVSVCAGYSKAFLYLCQKAGIECIYVPGFTKNNISHAWNLIKLNNNYYWVDTTWGDPVFADLKDNITNYNYFLVSDSDFLRNHVIDSNVRLQDGTLIPLNVYFPPCIDDSLNYYNVNGCYFKDFNKQGIDNYLLYKLNNGKFNNIEFKFSTEHDYKLFLSEYFEGEDAYIFSVIRKSRSFYYSAISINYSMLDSAYYVSLNVSKE